MTLRNLIGLLAASVLLTACATNKYVVSDVTAFAANGGPSGDQSFAIVPTTEEQRTSLAFAQAAAVLASRLEAAGLRAHSEGAGVPVLVATLTYGVEGPSPDAQSRFRGSVGVGYHSNPFYGYGRIPFGADGYRDMKTYQTYIRRAEVSLFEGATYGTDEARKVYEVKGLSEGRTGHVDPVLPFMIDAMLAGFPAGNGEAQRVEIIIPEGSDLLMQGSGPSIRYRQ